MTTTRVRHIPITRTLLAKIPQAERKWVFFFGHVANEITLLNKLLLWSHVPPGSLKAPTNIAAAVQTVMIAKMLAGKQYEAAQVLSQSYFDSPMRRIYYPLMELEGQKAEDQLKAYFSTDNLHYRVRNSFAFHYSVNELAGEIIQSAKIEELQILLSANAGNTLFDMSETVANRAMLATIDPDTKAAVSKFTDAVVEVSRWYQRFIDDFIAAVLNKHWGKDFEAWGGSWVEVPAEPFEKISVPWFFAA